MIALISGFIFLFVNTYTQTYKGYVLLICSIIKFDYPIQIFEDNYKVVIK